jgi:hypothetical protein
LDVARAAALLLNDAARWDVATFDGTRFYGVRAHGTHGDVHVMVSDSTEC